MLLHITAARGPAECELAVGKFTEALAKERKIEVLASVVGRYDGCLKSALIKTDDGMPDVGTVQWICKSPFRPHHGRKNWFIGVNRVEEPSGADYETAEDGVIFQTFRASGKGGQHVNKTESAVRAIHISTGLSAVASDERSQLQNKKLALERLKALMQKQNAEAELSEKNALFFNHNNLVRGFAVRVYEGEDFKRTK